MAPPSPANAPSPEAIKRTEAMHLVQAKLEKYCGILTLPLEVQYKAEELYVQAYDAKLKRGTSLRAFLCACLFLATQQEYEATYISNIVGTLDADIPKTVQAMWRLENFLADGTVVIRKRDRITVTCVPSDSRQALRMHQRPSVEVHLTWPEDPKPVVTGDLYVNSPSLREMRAQRKVLAEKTSKQPERSKEMRTTQDNSTEGVE
ncbi:MAG: hypothetical protein HETSPECPRED_001293 [Heterodermia speciosa]|uniref:Transcription factor TFIIB cyclin-like domain-containing protein n=1 Tax=Heterodermia speciosa TaxID=116794 RepID=A0A8H3IGP6_9LECA|nr:MAG: hypothetical protein HETSPECPRED_001293 [Heterodermia speciosa]